MNRRNFLRLGTGGLIASATAAEVGMWAEFVSWLQRKPVWSIPKPPISILISSYADYMSFSDLALATAFHGSIETLKQQLILKEFSKRRPLPMRSGAMIQMFTHNPLQPVGLTGGAIQDAS